MAIISITRINVRGKTLEVDAEVQQVGTVGAYRVSFSLMRKPGRGRPQVLLLEAPLVDLFFVDPSTGHLDFDKLKVKQPAGTVEDKKKDKDVFSVNQVVSLEIELSDILSSTDLQLKIRIDGPEVAESVRDV